MLKSEELAGTVFYLVRKDSFLILDYSGGAGGGLKLQQRQAGLWEKLMRREGVFLSPSRVTTKKVQRLTCLRVQRLCAGKTADQFIMYFI